MLNGVWSVERRASFFPPYSLPYYRTLENMKLTSEDFRKIRDMVYARTGLYFEEKKLYFVEKRIARRARATGCDSPWDYYLHLKYDDGGEEFSLLIDVLTTNETYLFREYPQLEVFAEEVLPRVLEEKEQRGDRRLQVWSAGCSTGEEPYTLAIILREMMDDLEDWQVSVYGTDINQQVLKAAKRAVYGPRAMKDVPEVYRRKYFSSNGTGDTWKVALPVRSMITFRSLNLTDRRAVRAYRNIDFVFCRNVLIYFDDRSRKQVVNTFYNSLRKGGYLFLGHSESVGRISAAFRPERAQSTVVYRR